MKMLFLNKRAATATVATILLAGLSLLCSSPALAGPPAQTVLANGSLKIAYRQVEDGKEGRSIHLMELECFNGHCSLTTLTLNQCMDMPFLGNVFYPKIQRSRSGEGNLKVRMVAPGRLVAEELMDGATFTYNYQFTTKKEPEFAKAWGLKTDVFFDKLTGFSGAAVKHSSILDKVVSWQLSPMKGSPAKVNLDCSALVDGLPEGEGKELVPRPKESKE